MYTVSVHEAKTQLSLLLSRVEAGETIFIARNGKPVAQLVPITTKYRKLGRLRGKIHIKEDFDAPLPDDIAAALLGERP